MKQFYISLILLSIIFHFQGFATEVKLNNNAQEGFEATILKSDNESTVIEMNLNAYKLNPVKIDGKTYYTISINGGSPMLEKGNPDLDKLTSSIIIPDEAKMKLSITASEFIDYKDIEVAPSKGNLYRNVNPDDIPYTFSETYSDNAYYPGELASTRNPYIFRDYRGQTVVFNPLQYNPVKKQLRVYTKIVVELVATNEKGVNILEKKTSRKMNAEFDHLYKKQFLNYESSAKYTAIEEEGTMLVVCHTDYLTQMESFVEWKNIRGLQVEMVEYSEIASSAEDLQDYVVDYYNNNDLVYLLLVGDGEFIPSLYKSGDSDAAYGHIDGDDSYAEVFVGRFSAETTADVETMVERIINYEKELTSSDTWLNIGIGIASDEGGPGQGDDDESDIEHMDNIRNDLTGYTYTSVAQVYDPGATPGDVSSVLNDGAGIINYVGHGSDYAWSTTGFDVDDVDALTNEYKLPFIFDVACVNGNFHGRTCFAESWMRATNNDNPAGAVGIIASTINQSWAPPMDGQDEMNDILVETYNDNIKRTYGGITINGCMHMNDEYGTSGDEMTDTWTIFSDPSLLVRTNTPEAMTINHDAEIFVGSSSASFNCDVEDATVALSIDGQLIGSARVASGTATVNFEAVTAVTTIDVIITGYNAETYVGTISVVPAEGPYLSVDTYNFSDAAGNNNGRVEIDESIVLDVALKNVGVELASQVSSTVTIDNEFIEIAKNDYDYGDIDVDQTVSGSDFEFDILPGIADQTSVAINLHMIDDNLNEWDKTLNMTINAPALEINYIGYEEVAGESDGNGFADAGEQIKVLFSVENTGSFELVYETVCELESTNANINIVSGIYNVATLAAEQLVEGEFVIAINEGVDNGTVVDFDLLANGDFYNATASASIKVGLIVEDFESADFSSFDWQFAGDAAWSVTDQTVYEGSYAIQSDDISDDQSAELIIEGEVLANDVISFYKKVSSESDYDWLQFYIDDELQNEWSGEVDWSFEEYEVTAGNHTFKWVYNKDYSFSNGSDCGWIDYVILPPMEPINYLPEFTTTPVTDAYETIEYIYEIEISDDNADQELTLSAVTVPAWLTFTDNEDGTAKLEGTPTVDEVGDHNVSLEVSDGIADPVAQDFVITVHANELPYFTSTPDTIVTQDSIFNYQVRVNDTDPSPRYAIVCEEKPAWLSFEYTAGNTATLSGTPTASDIGEFNVVLGVTDSIMTGHVLQEFTILVNKNYVPYFNTTPLTEVYVDSIYEYIVIFADSNANANLTVTCDTKPDWINFTVLSDTSVRLYGIPEAADTIDNEVVVALTDGIIANPVLHSFEIDVTEFPNEAPEFTSLPDTVIYADSVYTYNITCADADGNAVEILCATKPDWLAFTDNGDGTALLQGTPAENDEGAHAVKVTLTDHIIDLPVAQEFYIHVNVIPNTPPVITTNPDTVVYADSVYEYIVHATDEDGDDLEFVCTEKPDWLTFELMENNQAKLSGTPGSIDIGMHSIEICVTDHRIDEMITHNYTLHVMEAVGIGNVNTLVFDIFPNPASDYIICTLENNSSGEIRIVDLLGNTVYENNAPEYSNRIEIGNLNQGIYFVIFTNNETQISKQIVIE